MKKQIYAVAFTLLSSTLLCALPGFAKAKSDALPAGNNIAVGVADQTSLNAPPTSTLMPLDVGGFKTAFPASGKVYAPGVFLQGVVRSNNFGGMNWLGYNQGLLTNLQSGAAPNHVNCTFELPAGTLVKVGSPLKYPNPNLTFVLEDIEGNYFFSANNNGNSATPLHPTLLKAAAMGNGNYDAFSLTAQNNTTDFNAVVDATVGEWAIVWAGAGGIPGNPNIGQNMWISDPNINAPDISTGNNKDFKPTNGIAAYTDALFNFSNTPNNP